MQPHVEDEQNGDGDGDGEGEGGSGDFGRPQLKPNLEALFDPSVALAESHAGEQGDASAGSCDVEHFGQWELHAASLMLYHRQLKKRLMLRQLDAPSKMMKVIVALSTQSHAASDWDVEHLVKALDHAANRKFGRGLYHLIGLSSDTSRLDWMSGTVGPIGHQRPTHGAL